MKSVTEVEAGAMPPFMRSRPIPDQAPDQEADHTSGYNADEVEQFLHALDHGSVDGVTEIRIFPIERQMQIGGRRQYVGKTVSGYYNPDHYADAVRDIAAFDGKANIYVCLNPAKKELLARAANRLKYDATTTTSDKGIKQILWFPIDCDAKREADISASGSELQAALDRRDAITALLEAYNIPFMQGMSGNGGHILVRLPDCPNDPATAAQVPLILQRLDSAFSDEIVGVDLKVGNAARIWKLYGTLAMKGDDITDRPHRRATIQIPSVPLLPVQLDRLLSIIPEPESTSEPEPAQSTFNASKPRASHSGGRLDVDAYLAGYNIAVKVKKNKGDITLWELKQCPFNHDHAHGEAHIQQDDQGKLGAACKHDSCTGNGWQQFKAAIGDIAPYMSGGTYPSGGLNGGRKPSGQSTSNGGSKAAPDQEADDFVFEFTTDSALDESLSEITWLWEGYIPNGFLTGIVGEQDQGKSMVTQGVCDIVLRGTQWPDGKPHTPHPDTKLLWIDTEGSIALLHQRMKDWGMPRGRFILPPDPLQELTVDDFECWRWIEAAIERFKPPLVVIDALSGAHRSGKENGGDEMKPIMKKLAGLAQKHNIAVVIVHHLNKPAPGAPSYPITIHRLRGSTAIPQYCRSILAVGTPDQNRPESRRLDVIKLNLARKPAPVGYELTDHGPAFGEAPEPPKERRAVDVAIDFLQERLMHGIAPSDEVNAEAKARSIGMNALNDAKKVLGIKAKREGGKVGRWMLIMPNWIPTDPDEETGAV